MPVLVVAVVEAAMCAACTSIRATDGRVFSSGDEAVRASAAHDLGCGPDIVEVNNVGVDDNAEAVVDGCGWRATYRYSKAYGAHFGDKSEVVLVSRFPAGSGGPLAPSFSSSSPGRTSGAGCSKDTDCKGDRVCVRGQCADPPVRPATPAPSAQ